MPQEGVLSDNCDKLVLEALSESIYRGAVLICPENPKGKATQAASEALALVTVSNRQQGKEFIGKVHSAVEKIALNEICSCEAVESASKPAKKKGL